MGYKTRVKRDALMGLHALLLLLHGGGLVGGRTLSVQFQVHPSSWVFSEIPNFPSQNLMYLKVLLEYKLCWAKYSIS